MFSLYARPLVLKNVTIGSLHDPVTWSHGTLITQWDFRNKGKSGWTGTSSFVLEVPLRNLRPSAIYSVPCDWIVQRVYCLSFWIYKETCDSKVRLDCRDTIVFKMLQSSKRKRKAGVFKFLGKTLVKVWENSKKLWKHSPAARVPTAFLVLPNFHSCLYLTIRL